MKIIEKVKFIPKQLKVKVFTLLLVLAFGGQAVAADNSEGGQFSAGDMILHHVGDAHEWHFFDGHYGTLYLPVIVYTEDRGLEVFSSANFYDEAHNLVPYKGYMLDHGHISRADGTPVLDLSITKNVASMLLSAVILLLVFISIANSYKKKTMEAPKGLQSFLEPIVMFVRDEIAIPNIGPKYARYLPFLLTLFFFIWINNLLGLLPGAANVTGNIAVTLVLALIVLIITVVSGTKTYWAHIFNTPGVPWWLKWGIPIMPVVEVIGIFTKPFSLMIRLFANITAGHIIILSLFSLIFIFESVAIGPVSVAFATFMYFLELFVALLQAYIFTLLAAMYFGGATEEHHDQEHHHDPQHVDQAQI
jgi:F-type H+-transporting ATPase subunit a